MKIIHNAYPAKHEIIIRTAMRARLDRSRRLLALRLRKLRSEFPLNDLLLRGFGLVAAQAASGTAGNKLTEAHFLGAGSAFLVLADYIEQSVSGDARKLNNEIMKDKFSSSTTYLACLNNALHPAMSLSEPELSDIALLASGAGGARNSQRRVAEFGLFALRLVDPNGVADGDSAFYELALRIRFVEACVHILDRTVAPLTTIDEKGVNLVRINNLRSVASALMGVALAARQDEMAVISHWAQHPWFLTAIRLDSTAADQLARGLNLHAARGLTDVSRPSWPEVSGGSSILDASLLVNVTFPTPPSPVTDLASLVPARLGKPLYVDIELISRIAPGLGQVWSSRIWIASQEIARLDLIRASAGSAASEPVPLASLDAGGPTDQDLIKAINPIQNSTYPLISPYDGVLYWAAEPYQLASLGLVPYYQHSLAAIRDKVPNSKLMPVALHDKGGIDSEDPIMIPLAPVTSTSPVEQNGLPRTVATIARVWNVSMEELTQLLVDCLKQSTRIGIRGIAEAFRLVGILVITRKDGTILARVRPLSQAPYHTEIDTWKLDDPRGFTIIDLTPLISVPDESGETQKQLKLACFNVFPDSAHIDRSITDLALVTGDESNLRPLVVQMSESALVQDVVDPNAAYSNPEILGWRPGSADLSDIILVPAKPAAEDTVVIVGSNDERGPSWVRRRNAIVTISDDDAIPPASGAGPCPHAFSFLSDLGQA